MSKHKLDGLFREGLGSHKVAPRSEAWTKLKENLDSDRKKGLLVYWRVAAIVLLCLGSVLLVYKIKKSDKPVTLADKPEKIAPPGIKETNTNQLAAVEDLQTTDQNGPAVEQTGNKASAVANVKKQTAQQPQKGEKTGKSTKQHEESAIDKLQKNQVVATDNQTLAIVKENRLARKVAIPAETVSPVKPKNATPGEVEDPTLTLALQKQPIDHEVTDKPDLPMVSITFKKDTNLATDEVGEDDKEVRKLKRFALMKVISLAKNINDGEVGISTLRKKKDELLAFNFNKKKNLKNTK
ncbi:hypothetical protein QQ020_25350 [Fulvivirgaceae bacterium BMA12]|uniref:Uncharacterized protein n=1 Tax=Agaribacillus aureus TaxID=3051825 RepID=A0ABT8LDX0_9BACT|nr:hypothetical protein [Fulvivirgaceae bacterium BMA12]